jgi:hypothetical protein
VDLVLWSPLSPEECHQRLSGTARPWGSGAIVIRDLRRPNWYVEARAAGASFTVALLHLNKGSYVAAWEAWGTLHRDDRVTRIEVTVSDLYAGARRFFWAATLGVPGTALLLGTWRLPLADLPGFYAAFGAVTAGIAVVLAHIGGEHRKLLPHLLSWLEQVLGARRIKGVISSRLSSNTNGT